MERVKSGEESGEKRERENMAPEKMHLCCSTIDSTRSMPSVNTSEKGHTPGQKVMWRLILAQCSYSHLERQLSKSMCNRSQCFKYLVRGTI